MLKEYLKSIADMIRFVLGTNDTINAQEFPDKIEEVYNKGYEVGKWNGEDVYVLLDGVDITIADGVVIELLKSDFSMFDAIAFPEGITGIDLVDKNVKRAGQPLVANKVIMPTTLKTITQYSFANRVIFKDDDGFDENSPTIKKQGWLVWEDASVKVRVKEFVLNEDLNIDNTTMVFAQNLYLEKINIPLKAEAIPGYNFVLCINLAEVIIPESVKTINHFAFEMCDRLKIYGYKDTTAETFALSQNIPFVDIQSDLTEFEQGYFFGGLDYSPKETVSGEVIGITDISPIEHNMGVSVRRNNILKYPYYQTTKTISGITYTDNGDGSITVNGTATAFSIFEITQLSKMDCSDLFEDGVTYKMNNTDYSIVGFVLCTREISTNKTVYYYGSNSFTVNKSMYKYEWIRLQVNAGITVNNYTVYPMISEGTVEKPYAPYIEDISTVKLFKSGEGVEPVMYDVNADGTVQGVKSLYPSTTLYTDTQGAVIDCTYYQDGKKVKENLTDMILELGGVINE